MSDADTRRAIETIWHLAAEPALAHDHLRHAVRGDLLAQLGRGAAAGAFEEAARLTYNAGERAVMLRRAAEAWGNDRDR